MMNQAYGHSGRVARCSGGFDHTPCRTRSRQGMDRGLYPFGRAGMSASSCGQGCGTRGADLPPTGGHTHGMNGGCGCGQTKPTRNPFACGQTRTTQNTCGCGQLKPKQNTCGCGQTKPNQNTCGCGQTKPNQDTCGCEQTKPNQNTCGCGQSKPNQDTCGCGQANSMQNAPLHTVSASPAACALMDRIRAVDFALYETILYLDVYPHSCLALETYHKLRVEREALHGEYEAKFGPLTAFGNESTTSWDWMSRPAPWEYGAE